MYEQHGVREYWIVEPAAQYVEVWQHFDEKFALLGFFGVGETFASVVLGQSEVVVAPIFGG